jgi:hypothetical protein
MDGTLPSCDVEQCLRFLSVKGLHDHCGFRLTCGSNGSLLSVGGDSAAVGHRGFHAIAG